MAIGESEPADEEDWTTSPKRYSGMNAGPQNYTTENLRVDPEAVVNHLYEAAPPFDHNGVDAISPREKVLQTATDAVMKGRNNTYGPPTQDFARAAGMLNALGFQFIDAEDVIHDIKPHHIAMMQIAVKLSRATWSPEHFDHFVDICGYSACAWECVESERE